MMSQSNYSVCYEPIQRIYRNAVVRSARRALSAAYPDWQSRLQAVFSKTWDKLREDAMERRTTGELGTKIVDDLDYLGVSQFFSLFEAFFDIIFPPPVGIAATARQQERQAVLQWAREVRVLRDPMSHPSEEDLPFPDAFRMLDAARRILLKLDAEAAVAVEEAMHQLQGGEAESVTDVDVIRSLDGFLPPPESVAIEFVGRHEELNVLRAWFQDPDKRRWALMGDGGKGKSAIAYEFACEVRDSGDTRFDFVIWLSAKRQRFDEGQAQRVPSPDFSDLDSALDWLLLHYGWGDSISEDQKERRDLCLTLLDEFPALIVVDDIDSLEGVEESAIEFFTLNVPTTHSKVLLTSRRKPMGLGATTTVVEGFNRADADSFIRSRIGMMDLDPASFPPAAVTQIFEATDGSPLFIEDMLRLCAFGVPPRDAIKEWRERGGDAARNYALGREFSMLTPNAKSALLACAVSDGPVSLAEIQAVTGLTDDQARGAIDELQRLFLVPKPKLIEDVERFDLNLNTRVLVRTQMAAENPDLYRKVEGGFRALSGDLALAPQRLARIGAFIRQAVGLVKQNRHDDALKTLEAGLAAYPNDPDLLGQLGWLYRVWKPRPRVSEARECFQRAVNLNNHKVDLYVHWSEMEAQQGEWTRAAEAAEAGLPFHAESSRLLFAAGYARARLGRDLIREFQPRGKAELVHAIGFLRRSLRDPERLNGYQDRLLQSRAFRAICLAIGNLVDLMHDRTEQKDKIKFSEEGIYLVGRWRAEHPDDTYSDFEGARLANRFRNNVISIDNPI
jgi:tetratricopeptide (TPR) repeat protein